MGAQRHYLQQSFVGQAQNPSFEGQGSREQEKITYVHR
jgi:hypothetical protein